MAGQTTLPFDGSGACSSYLTSASTSDDFQRLLKTHFVEPTRLPGLRNPFSWIALLTLHAAIVGVILSTSVKEFKSKKASWATCLIVSLALTALSFLLFLISNYWNANFAFAYTLYVVMLVITSYMNYRRERMESPSLCQVLFRRNKEHGVESGTNPTSTPKESSQVLTDPPDQHDFTGTVEGDERAHWIERGEMGRKDMAS
jgi:hypothetical protein